LIQIVFVTGEAAMPTTNPPPSWDMGMEATITTPGSRPPLPHSSTTRPLLVPTQSRPSCHNSERMLLEGAPLAVVQTGEKRVDATWSAPGGLSLRYRPL